MPEFRITDGDKEFTSDYVLTNLPVVFQGREGNLKQGRLRAPEGAGNVRDAILRAVSGSSDLTLVQEIIGGSLEDVVVYTGSDKTKGAFGALDELIRNNPEVLEAKREFDIWNQKRIQKGNALRESAAESAEDREGALERVRKALKDLL